MTDPKQTVKLVEDGAGLNAASGIDPNVIGSVEVVLEAYLGSTTIAVSELMKLQKGSSLVLDSSLDRDVELRLNGVAVARGELVAIEDHYGVRILEIVR